MQTNAKAIPPALSPSGPRGAACSGKTDGFGAHAFTLHPGMLEG